MSDDIVARLRSERWDSLTKSAADEIERLRAERDGYLDGNRQTLAALAEANEIAKKYKAERDEARRLWCVEIGELFSSSSLSLAKERGWDCFRDQL